MAIVVRSESGGESERNKSGCTLRAAFNAFSVIRRKYMYTNVPVEVSQELPSKHIRVFAAADAAEGTIVLPPCFIRENGGLVEDSSSPLRVPITVRALGPKDKGQGKGVKVKGKAQGDKRKTLAGVTAERKGRQSSQPEEKDDPTTSRYRP